MSAETVERVEATSQSPMRPIAHVSLDGGEAALCGAMLFGVPAFGDYDRCVVCDDLSGDSMSGQMTVDELIARLDDAVNAMDQTAIERT